MEARLWWVAPGALIAGCWASLMAMGESGYVDSCHSIVSTRVTIENALKEASRAHTSLRVIGEPMVSVVAFESVDPIIDIYDVAAVCQRGGI
jgi:sphinganine-1-phosphate aldolase